MIEELLTISIFKDGDQYCAVFTDDFTDLQESASGWGLTELDAIAELLENR